MTTIIWTAKFMLWQLQNCLGVRELHLQAEETVDDTEPTENRMPEEKWIETQENWLS